MHIYLDPNYNWSKEQIQGADYYHIGRIQTVLPTVQTLRSDSPDYLSDLINALNTQTANFAGIIETEDKIIAFVDYERSYPIFYSQTQYQITVSNSARLIKEICGINQVDATGLLEFTMSGYVTGPNTVYEGLYQLQPGELLYFNKSNQSVVLHRYFTYHPCTTELKQEKEYIHELDILFNRIFTDIIQGADGAPIWIPLSGGLDSRLIVSKLHQLGYKNLHTFSYGPCGNYEAKAAKAVAEHLGVPWHFMSSVPSRSRRLFLSQDRIDYWNFADGLSSIPSISEYEGLMSLREKGLLPDDAVLINGQSGDFTTGGHIPIDLLIGTCSVKKMTHFMIKKHFNTWRRLNIKDSFLVFENKILSLLQLDPSDELTMEEIAANYEQWEWQERQSKYVVNGQRLYDFYGYQWELPLWDGEFVRYYKTIPLQHRLKQSLYIKYLDQFNYQGLFSGYRSENRRWTGMLQYVVPVADRLEHFFLKNNQTYTNYLSYWGHYHDLYSLYGIQNFLKIKHNVTMPPHGRAIASLGIQEWLILNNLTEYIDGI